MRIKLLAAALLAPVLTFAKTEVSFLFCYDPAHPEEPTTRRLLELAREDGEFVPVKWGGLRLPGGGGRATFMLALAASSAPDIYKAWFHILRHDVEQGFIYPLDEWVSPPERPEGLWDRVRVHDGHVWALPAPGVAYYGIVYRKDLVARAGLDPEDPPRTWTAFRAWCRRLTGGGVRAFAIENRPWGFLPWVQSAGGDVVRPRADGRGYEACFDSQPAVEAAEFLRELVRDGSIRALPTLSVADDVGRLFAAGEIVAVFGGEDLVRRLTEVLQMDANTIGLMAFPAADKPSGMRVLQAHRHFYAMSETVARRPKCERDQVWKCLETLASVDLADAEIRRNVAEGRAQWCTTADLRRLGYVEEADALSPGTKALWKDLAAGEIKCVTEPWNGFWQAASDLLQRRFLGLLLSDAGAQLDCRAALAGITADANRGLMFDADRRRIERARPYARIVAGAIATVLFVIAAIVWRSRRCTAVGGEQTSAPRRRGAWIAWLFLAPALLSVLLWSYYPLVKGAMMAFQNYRIVGESSFAGLDNFIRVSCNPGFWSAWGRTLEYAAITIVIGFLSPVVLALLLCEIPRGRIFYRFLYFLPHLTSALVVVLLWKLLYDPTENGMLNRLLAVFGIARQSWLLDPAWAMLCTILPGAWASAGVSALIYIAALESLPRDTIEAAAIDGAGVFARLRHIVLPQIAPLMIINLAGAFIAAFQGMGSIFLLTFGGPGDATEVLSLSIWKEAYNNLRFSTATTMAWYLGVSLIAAAYLQIRLLRRVEFRTAA